MLTNLELIGFIVSILGILLTFWQVYDLRKTIFFDKMRDGFLNICTTPQITIIPLDDLYKSIIDYYKIKIQKNPDLILIDSKYLNHCFAEIPNVQFPKEENFYRFPLVAIKHYLLSYNPDLIISYGSFDFDKESENTLDKASKQFLSKLEIENLSSFIANGKRIWDQWTFDIYNAEYFNNSLSLHFMRGSYFKYVNRNELLSRETFFHYQTKNKSISSSTSLLKIRLPKENAARSMVFSEDFYDFSKRATTIGFHIFVIMHKGEGKYCTFVQKRGNTQVEYPGFYHVAPAGTFQPLSEFDAEVVKTQCNFAFTVIREFLEEIFNMEKIDKYKGIDPFKIFTMEAEKGFCPGSFLIDHLDIQKLPMESRNYKIVPTGFYVDLMTLKPQLSFVFIVKNEGLYQQASKQFQGNWEGEVKEFDLDENDILLFLERNLHVKSVPPPGAVAFAEGIHYYYKNNNQLRNIN